MQSSPSTFGMRTDPSMSQGGEFDSPHMNAMEGDMSKVNPLRNIGASKGVGDMNGGHRNIDARDSFGMDYENGTNSNTAPVMPQIQEPVFHQLPQSSSWSNVVSSGSPIKLTRSSDETLLTSNTASSQPPNFDYLSQRSNSFDTAGDRSTFDLPQQRYNSNATLARKSQQNLWGMSPSQHPVSSSMGLHHHMLPTIQQGSPMMYPNTPHHNAFASRDFKRPHNLVLSSSPLSLGSTDQTSPMSSPSMSPHLTPLQLPRQGNQSGGAMSPCPPMWQLSSGLNSDANEFQADSPQRKFHPQPPQSSPQYQYHHSSDQAYGQHQFQNMPPYPHHHGGTRDQAHNMYSRPSYNTGPISPSRRSMQHPPGHHQQQMQSRRPGTKLNAGLSTGPLNRSSTEVLKTLLRKKACLYEPETSFSVALVTWLVGRRLALSQGYFSRQQLQSGVHFCVSSKIEQGHVTRTKVNRCMQIILNSCFHYIIPRPDGSEESGEMFRGMFSHEAADEDRLIRSLPPPWNDLSIDALDEEFSRNNLFYGSDDEASHQSPRASQGKPPSSAASQAGESIDSGSKRSVLLCFNENIRSAADVFRCHNEFIRDVAHSANLSLSPEEWRCFFAGTKIHRKRSPSADSAASRYFSISGGSAMPDLHDRMDEQGLSKFRTTWCAKRYDHDQELCAFAHIDVNRGWLRRDPFVYNYKPTLCPCVVPLKDAEDCYVNMCPHGVGCNHAHSKEEILYHPESYKRGPCKSQANSCPLRDICPNIHTNKQNGLSDSSHHSTQGYNRQGKRHHYDESPRESHSLTKRRVTNTPGHNMGFSTQPSGSPMLYINPAPLSEFEKTLLLPGLQALFRDHSSSVLRELRKDESTYEYGLFGYKCNHPDEDRHRRGLAPIGRSGC